jgi:hypothetical protein
MLRLTFSKWSHLAYRPLALYLAEIHRVALPQPKAAAQPPELMKMAS